MSKNDIIRDEKGEIMEDLNIKQLTLALRAIAEEKNLPEDTVLEVIELSESDERGAYRPRRGSRI
jgi:hypothetical protein